VSTSADLTPPEGAFDWGAPAIDLTDVLVLADTDVALGEAYKLIASYRELMQRLLVANAKQTDTIKRLTDRLRETRRG
jgi:hypothetical protein